MIKTYRILSSLLDYPEQELWENLGEVEPLVAALLLGIIEKR